MGPGGSPRLQNDRDLTTSGWVGSIPTRSRHHTLAVPLPAPVTLMGGRRILVRALALALLVGSTSLARTAAAQRPDTTRARPDTTPRARPDATRGDTVRAAGPRQQRPTLSAARDSLAPPISPRRAFLYSALLPGLGQSRLDRGRAGAMFFTAEAVSILMAIKSADDLRFARAHARDSVVSKYDLNPDGTVKLDSLGRPVVLEYARNRYAGNRVRARRTHLEDWYAFLIFNHLIAGAEAFVSAQLWDFPARVSIEARPNGGGLSLSIPW